MVTFDSVSMVIDINSGGELNCSSLLRK